jgi:putative DNA-invertase from lambdoid prophage Rac
MNTPRVFAYCRVSTPDQTTDNQTLEIAAAGFAIQSKRIVTESISGSAAASERPGFAKLVDRMEAGDVLVVTKLDRLGRNAMDVRATVEALAATGIKVHCLALGGQDLTSSAGKLTMQIIAAVAEFERDLIIERTQAGQARARAEGKHMGRPAKTSPAQREAIRKALDNGATVTGVAAEYGVSRGTIISIRDAAQGAPDPLSFTAVERAEAGREPGPRAQAPVSFARALST